MFCHFKFFFSLVGFPETDHMPTDRRLFSADEWSGAKGYIAGRACMAR